MSNSIAVRAERQESGSVAFDSKSAGAQHDETRGSRGGYCEEALASKKTAVKSAQKVAKASARKSHSARAMSSFAPTPADFLKADDVERMSNPAVRPEQGTLRGQGRIGTHCSRSRSPVERQLCSGERNDERHRQRIELAGVRSPLHCSRKRSIKGADCGRCFCLCRGGQEACEPMATAVRPTCLGNLAHPAARRRTSNSTTTAAPFLTTLKMSPPSPTQCGYSQEDTGRRS